MVRLSLLLVMLLAASAGQAQPDTLAVQGWGAEGFARGVTWTVPGSAAEASAELLAMRQAGVEAVRFAYPGFGEAPVGAALFRTADQAGLALFLDLPASYLSAAALLDTLAFAQRVLAEVAALAEAHPSVRGVGLATAVDTSVPAACAYFEALAEPARAAGLRTYYRTRFVESDRCHGAVDAVLLDARGRGAAALLDRWERVHGTPAGIAALGTEVRTASGGHLTAGTEAHQQRTLEESLRALGRRDPVAVFVHTWRGPRYGLHDAEGDPRPALAVLSGFYTGRQTVFAVDAGRAPVSVPGAHGFTLLGWILGLLLFGLIALAPRFRQLVPRYFTRHGYYREAVQRSAGLEGFAAAAVVGGLALAGGLLIGAGLYGLAEMDVLEVAVGGFGEARAERLLGWFREPLGVVALGALLYGAWVVLNGAWLLALAGRRRRVRPMQALILTTFSRWAVFVLALLALLALQSGDPGRWLPPVLWSWLAVEFIAGARMFYDYSRVTRVPMGRAIGVGYFVPIAVVLVGMGVALWLAGPSILFLWHLATRT